MTAAEIMKVLGDDVAEAPAPKAAAEIERFFVFAVGESWYALPPSAVREIISDLEIFPLPSCPPYVAGLVNCHGIPHTAIALMLLLRNERDRPARFLVLNVADDRVVFGCTEVVEIVLVPRASISTFPEGEADSKFFAGLFALEGRRVPILSVGGVLRQLELDLA